MSDRVVRAPQGQTVFKTVFLAEKLNNWQGYLLTLLLSVGLAALISFNLVLGLAVVAALVGIVVLLTCLLNAAAGFYIIMVFGFVAPALSRFFFRDELPMGSVTDILIFTTFLGLFLGRKSLNEQSKTFFHLRPVIWYVVILVYISLELFNPIGHSFFGWLQVMRKMLESFILVFIGYQVFAGFAQIRWFLNFLFCLALMGALYGCFQQFFGLLPRDLEWVNSDPVRYGLICIWGEYRKFSFMSGPMEFGVIMAACGMFFMLLGWTDRNKTRKTIYIAGSLIMLLAMSYSGTRTANAMVAAGGLLFLLLTINKKSSRILAVMMFFAFLFVMYAPIYSSATLLRFRSTFSATQDASYNVREENRQTVQPFIWSHPFGSGMATTGGQGQKYNPGNPVAGFPTDSSYLNKALESGWIGLILTMLLYFFVMRYLFYWYFRAKNAWAQNVFAAASSFFFSYFVAELAQEAVGIYSSMVIFYPVLAVVLKLGTLSAKEADNTSEPSSLPSTSL